MRSVQEMLIWLDGSFKKVRRKSAKQRKWLVPPSVQCWTVHNTLPVMVCGNLTFNPCPALLSSLSHRGQGQRGGGCAATEGGGGEGRDQTDELVHKCTNKNPHRTPQRTSSIIELCHTVSALLYCTRKVLPRGLGIRDILVRIRIRLLPSLNLRMQKNITCP
jgi:hypothetical protein